MVCQLESNWFISSVYVNAELQIPIGVLYSENVPVPLQSLWCHPYGCHEWELHGESMRKNSSVEISNSSRVIYAHRSKSARGKHWGRLTSSKKNVWNSVSIKDCISSYSCVYLDSGCSALYLSWGKSYDSPIYTIKQKVVLPFVINYWTIITICAALFLLWHPNLTGLFSVRTVRNIVSHSRLELTDVIDL